MAISVLELRHIIESAFLPLRCRCIANTQGDLAIEVFDTGSGANVVLGGVPVASLRTSRAIADFIAQIRSEIALIKAATPLPAVGGARRLAR